MRQAGVHHSDLAVALDVLVATGVVTAGEAEAFLRARAEPPEQGWPPDRPALDKHLAAVWASLTPRVRSTLLAELDAAGALTSEQIEAYERRVGEPGPDDDWPDERVFHVHPGAVRETFAAPAQRVAGVLVVAVELGTESTCLHATSRRTRPRRPCSSAMISGRRTTAAARRRRCRPPAGGRLVDKRLRRSGVLARAARGGARTALPRRGPPAGVAPQSGCLVSAVRTDGGSGYLSGHNHFAHSPPRFTLPVE